MAENVSQEFILNPRLLLFTASLSSYIFFPSFFFLQSFIYYLRFSPAQNNLEKVAK